MNSNVSGSGDAAAVKKKCLNVRQKLGTSQSHVIHIFHVSQKSLFIGENYHAFLTSLAPYPLDIRVHRAGSQLKIFFCSIKYK